MPSLKEVKNRINSVTSTRKITSAMKMVASSKLHKAQASIESMLPYERQLSGIMSRFVGQLQGEADVSSPYAVKRAVRRAVVVAISSNSSLCGAFNSNVAKELSRVVDMLRSEGAEQVEVLTIGNKVAERARKMGFAAESHAALLDRPSYAEAAQIAARLMQRFADKEIDRVVLVYHHFKNTASQVLVADDLLPVSLEAPHVERTETGGLLLDYIVEPSQEEIVRELIPRVLQLKVYTALLDSLASEHAARVIAMQVATDNADELLADLTLMYNKQRQAAITAELLDIVGASFQ